MSTAKIVNFNIHKHFLLAFGNPVFSVAMLESHVTRLRRDGLDFPCDPSNSVFKQHFNEDMI